MTFCANIAYLTGEIATKAIESVQVKRQRTAVSQKDMETKQLAGEWRTERLCSHGSRSKF